MNTTLLQGATIINEGKSFKGSILIDGDKIKQVIRQGDELPKASATIDVSGKWVMPGIIDDQVHFREPGLIHKGDIYTESKAAVAGGVTSYLEMPNTSPQTTSVEALEQKYQIAAEKSLANYSFYMGATNDNLAELLKADTKKVCGVKVFMGSSTGNMLVDNSDALSRIFAEVPMLIATHCEDETTIARNMEHYKAKYGDNVPFNVHHLIRSETACFISSAKAVELAVKYNAKLHLLHLSTAKELSLLENKPLDEKRITGEVCVHHLWFDNNDYDRYGARIKWNPAIKTSRDKEGLLKGLLDNKLDVIATDHAPHTIEEKNNGYFKAPSGGPLVQHSLVAMLEMSKQGRISREAVVEKMCHAPAKLYEIEKRGFIRKGYFADLTVVDPSSSWTVAPDNILYKCGWSPFEGTTFAHKVTHTFVNGHLAYQNGNFDETKKGERLIFNR
ncbi:MAG: dihydroorotase [Breznakibacter sp.]